MSLMHITAVSVTSFGLGTGSCQDALQMIGAEVDTWRVGKGVNPQIRVDSKHNSLRHSVHKHPSSCAALQTWERD